MRREGTVDGDAVGTVVGIVLVLLGATGATLTQRHFEQRQRSARAPWFLLPFGVL